MFLKNAIMFIVKTNINYQVISNYKFKNFGVRVFFADISLIKYKYTWKMIFLKNDAITTRKIS